MRNASARENHPTREKAWGDFHARSRFARSTIPEEKWGTTRSLVIMYTLLFVEKNTFDWQLSVSGKYVVFHSSIYPSDLETHPSSS